MKEIKSLVCHFDGGYNNLKKTNGYGSFRVLNKKTLGTVLITSQFPDVRSSNEAEYEAITRLLRYLISRYVGYDILIYGDSKLVINQLSGSWQVRSKTLTPYHTNASGLINEIRDISSIRLAWTPRENIVEVLGH